MKLLLDTNALIWWMADDLRLGSRARALLADPSHQVMATIVSLWEITLKWRTGKLERPGSVYVPFLSEESIALLPVSAAHLERLERLEFHHRDPFDHLIIAQADVEGAAIVSSDRDMALYGVPVVPAMR